MINYGVELLPFTSDECGGYKLIAFFNPATEDLQIIGPSSANYYHHEIPSLHNLYLQQDLMHWINEQVGPKKTPEARRIIAWDCSLICSLLLRNLILNGYTQTPSWTPKKGEFFLLEDTTQVHTLVLRTHQGTEIRFLSLKAFIRAGSEGLQGLARQILGITLGDLPIESWGEPTAGGVHAIIDYSMCVQMLYKECYNSGYIWESSGRMISAGGIAWRNFTRELHGKNNREESEIQSILWPGMTQAQIIEARDVMEDYLRIGNRGGIVYAVAPGEYDGVYGYDLNSAYGASLCEYIPYGPLLANEPEGPHVAVVWPKGCYVLSRGRVPVLSWNTDVLCARYAFERQYKANQKVFDFFLDGSMPFFWPEWQLLMQFYEPISADAAELEMVAYFETMYFGILADRMKRLHYGGIAYPMHKVFFKMQIVGLYGKMCQNQIVHNIWYYLDENHKPARMELEDQVRAQHLGIGMWIASYCRCRIMDQLLHIPAEDVVYIDSDQIYLQGDHSGDFKISDYIGDWKVEQDNVKMNLCGPKQYQLMDQDGLLSNKAATLPIALKRGLKFGDLQPDRKYHGFKFEWDPKQWIRAPVPCDFTAATTAPNMDTDDIIFVAPEAVENANKKYTD